MTAYPAGVSFLEGAAAAFRPAGWRPLRARGMAAACVLSGAVGALAIEGALRGVTALSVEGFGAVVDWWGTFFGVEPDRFAIWRALALDRFTAVGLPSLERTLTLVAFLGAFGVVQVLALPVFDRLTLAVARLTPYGRAAEPPAGRGRVIAGNALLLAGAAAVALWMTELRLRGLLPEPAHRVLHYPVVILLSGLLTVGPALIRYGLGADEVRQRLRRSPGAVLGLGLVVGASFLVPVELLRHGAPLEVARAACLIGFAALPLGIVGGAQVAMRLCEAPAPAAPPSALFRAASGLNYAAGIAVAALWLWYGHTARTIVDGKQGLYHCDYALERVDVPGGAGWAAVAGAVALAGELLARPGDPPPPTASARVQASLRITNRWHRDVSIEPFRLRLLLADQRVAELSTAAPVRIAPRESGAVTMEGELSIHRPAATVRALVEGQLRDVGFELEVPLEPVLGLRPRLELPVWRWRSGG